MRAPVASIDFGPRGIVRIWPDADALATAAADALAMAVDAAVAARRRAFVALSGGSTPNRMGERLRQPRYRDAIAWSQTDIFWGDERWVPESSPESNAGTAIRLFLDQEPMSPDRIHRYATESRDPAAAAEMYEDEIRRVFGNPDGVPSFDLIFLGLGEDGHTASLFPETAAIHETDRLVVANQVDKLATTRLTFTPVLLNAAQRVIFLVNGEGKASILSRVLEGREEPDHFPAQIVRPVAGSLEWFIDQPAASALSETRT
ncbi:MAG TPA: 6-phosphogluconolactonase [Thermomicrobiales bacterium]|nr:6-phosphogluconolactonase [Thermomicrobiales bacterium]